MEKEWGREIQKSIPLSSACVHGRTHHKHITHTQKERETGGRAILRLSDYDPNTDIPYIQELHTHVFFSVAYIMDNHPHLLCSPPSCLTYTRTGIDGFPIRVLIQLKTNAPLWSLDGELVIGYESVRERRMTSASLVRTQDFFFFLMQDF